MIQKRFFKKLLSFSLALLMATSSICLATPRAFAIYPDLGELDYGGLEIRKAKLSLLSYQTNAYGPLYIEPTFNSPVKEITNNAFNLVSSSEELLYIGESGDFYKGLTFYAMELVYIPKNKGRVYSSTFEYPVRPSGSYFFAPKNDISVVETPSDDGQSVSAVITNNTPENERYHPKKHLKGIAYYVKPLKGKKAQITIKGSKDKANDISKTFTKSLVLLLDGTETVRIKNAEIIHFYLAPASTIKRIISKYPDYFKVASSTEYVPPGEDDEISFMEVSLILELD